MPLDIHPCVEHTEHLDACVLHDEVCDSVVAVGRFANFPVGYWLISLTEPRMLAKKLDLGVDAPHDIGSGPRIVGRDVLVNPFEATQRLESPPYFGHDSIALATSSAVCVRPAAASSRPR